MSELHNREISWLSFNERVLQEAEDPSVPLIERMRFLGIFSNNQDEFFRVRVATVRRLQKFEKKKSEILFDSPQQTLNRIHEIVLKQQERFNKIYDQIIKELEAKNILIIDENQLTEEQRVFARQYYLDKVEPILVPIMLKNLKKFPYLNDDSIYLFVCLKLTGGKSSPLYSLIEIPRGSLSRFLVLPKRGDKKCIIYLEDVIRMNFSSIFSIFDYDDVESYIIKITRDAELDIEDDIVKGFYDKMKKSLERRKKGEPVRFVYDQDMPENFVNFLLKKMNLVQEDNIIPGGRYHNFKDFMKFPNVGGPDLLNPKIPPLPHPHLMSERSLLDVISKRDIMIHYPYQSFDYIIDMLREAAIDPKVESIKITLYRLASDSKIINALINAAKNGKEVTVVLELQARFDEEANLRWAKVLKDENVHLVLGISGLKVHSKLVLIEKKIGKDKYQQIAHVGTGNFHEGTATVYSDIAILTSDPRITNDIEKVFQLIEKPYLPYDFQNIMVSPIFMRKIFEQKIDREISNAKEGKKAGITIKLNSIVDKRMASKLYEASTAGVKVKMIVRGINALIPGQNGYSENIEAISIIDKYLEHARIYIFENDGVPEYFIGSADWMTRNLDYRIEVVVPVYDPSLCQELQDFIDIQWKDNTKARVFDGHMGNTYRSRNGDKKIRSQVAFYKYLVTKLR